MPVPERPSAEAFAVQILRDDPNVDYATIRDRAQASGISMHPIHYGRARKQLGLPALRDARPEPVARVEAPVAAPQAVVRETVVRDVAVRDVAVRDVAVRDVAVRDVAVRDVAVRGAMPVAKAGVPRKKGSVAFAFLVEELRKEPTLIYATLRDRCEQRGFKIAPIMYGRAKAVLGLVPVKPRGSKRAAAEAKAAAATATPSMPMQFKQVESVAADRFSKKLDDVRNIEQLVTIVRDLDAERRRLRDVLERVITMLDEALG